VPKTNDTDIGSEHETDEDVINSDSLKISRMMMTISMTYPSKLPRHLKRDLVIQ
jgi:hypothetical protein